MHQVHQVQQKCLQLLVRLLVPTSPSQKKICSDKSVCRPCLLRCLHTLSVATSGVSMTPQTLSQHPAATLPMFCAIQSLHACKQACKKSCTVKMSFDCPGHHFEDASLFTSLFTGMQTLGGTKHDVACLVSAAFCMPAHRAKVAQSVWCCMHLHPDITHYFVAAGH